MNKKVLFSVLIAIAVFVVGGAVLNVKLSERNANLSNTVLANIEALAQGEGGTTYYQTHCGSKPGTQCQTTLTGPLCHGYWGCPY